MKNRATGILALALILAAIEGFLACGGTKLEPSEVALDEDSCSQCRMAVSQLQFAAQQVTKEGTVDFFDDIGCLLEWKKASLVTRTGASFVENYNSEEWIPADSAFFVQSDKIPTPMNYGIAAFATRSEAETFEREVGGTMLTWNELVKGAKK